MFLKSIKLRNIRSYTNQTIDFLRGTTLLAGDIGSGKSSILLALEFGLFGALRSDLSADALLRKGTSSGSVELSCEIEGKEITLYRPLKKHSNGIKQMPGHIIMNGIKKELTALEMKAEIIGHLKYPEEFITKSKNYVFRYTVYCPQEEMKRILQESPQERLNILRKIFNIDKYKTIRDNLQTYLKTYRKKILVLETKIEPMVDLKKKMSQIIEQICAIQSQLKIKNTEKASITKQVKYLHKMLENEERGYSFFMQKTQQIHSLNQIKTQVTDSLVKEKEREKIAKEKLSEILIDGSIHHDKIQDELRSLSDKKEKWLVQKSKVTSQLSHLQEKIKLLQHETSQKEDLILQKRQLLKEKDTIQRVLDLKPILSREAEETFNKISMFDLKISEHETIQNQSSHILQSIATLDTCPTCLQKVEESYKESVMRNEKEKIVNLSNEIEIVQVHRAHIHEDFLKLQKRIEDITTQELNLREIVTTLVQLSEKISLLDTKKQEMKEKVVLNNEAMSVLASLTQDSITTIPRIEQRIKTLQKLTFTLTQKSELELTVEKSRREIQLLDKRRTEYDNKIRKAQHYLDMLEDNSLTIFNTKKELEKMLEKEKNIFTQHATFVAQIDHLTKRSYEISKDIDQLEILKIKLTQQRELYTWLNSYFMKLTYTIEKEVLLRIYHRFNDLFCEWFSLLMEESSISSRLDDAFTPVIEQNSHEIDFAHLSGGERTAVSLAYRLALNKVINDVVHTITTKDILILDEPTDGFSSEQLDKVRDVLDRLDLGQILIVSHETKIESFVENIIRIAKNDHVSVVY